MTIEYPHLLQQQLFYSSPKSMRWRSEYTKNYGWSVWVLGADHEPMWYPLSRYEVEPVPAMYYQARILVPAPERVAPPLGAEYYRPANTSVELWVWTGSTWDKEFLSAGLVYLTEAKAEARRQAWLKLEEE